MELFNKKIYEYELTGHCHLPAPCECLQAQPPYTQLKGGIKELPKLTSKICLKKVTSKMMQYYNDVSSPMAWGSLEV